MLLLWDYLSNSFYLFLDDLGGPEKVLEII